MTTLEERWTLWFTTLMAKTFRWRVLRILIFMGARDDPSAPSILDGKIISLNRQTNPVKSVKAPVRYLHSLLYRSETIQPLRIAAMFHHRHISSGHLIIFSNLAVSRLRARALACTQYSWWRRFIEECKEKKSEARAFWKCTWGKQVPLWLSLPVRWSGMTDCACNPLEL